MIADGKIAVAVECGLLDDVFGFDVRVGFVL